MFKIVDDYVYRERSKRVAAVLRPQHANTCWLVNYIILAVISRFSNSFV